MKDTNIDYFIHVDKKSDITPEIDISLGNAFLLPDVYRVDVRWGYSQVDATLNLLRYACCEDKYDFYWLISGQDFPLAKPQEILSYLSDNAESNFMQLAKTKNNGVGYNTSFDKRNEIIFPDWMMRQSLCFRILRRAWIEISGGYKKTFSFFKRKDENHLKYYFGSTWWCVNRTMTKYIFYFLQNNPQYSPFFTLSSARMNAFFKLFL